MMLNGVILRKLQSLDSTLEELYSLRPVTLDQLKDDWRTLRAAERDLQILIEIVVDVCQRLISMTGETPAATGAEAVKRCVELGALSDSETYRKMIQFRNFIVHRYEQVDPSIVVSILNHNLDDFKGFRAQILSFMKK
ncbi:hypothetical protein ES703_80162 [subsurface metagenome]